MFTVMLFVKIVWFPNATYSVTIELFEIKDAARTEIRERKGIENRKTGNGGDRWVW